MLDYFSFPSQELDSGDIQTLDALLPSNSGERRTLADIILSKLESANSDGVNVMQKVHQGTDHILVA